MGDVIRQNGGTVSFRVVASAAVVAVSLLLGFAVNLVLQRVELLEEARRQDNKETATRAVEWERRMSAVEEHDKTQDNALTGHVAQDRAIDVYRGGVGPAPSINGRH